MLIIMLVYPCSLWINAESVKVPSDPLFEVKERVRGVGSVAGVKQSGVPSMLYKRAPPATVHGDTPSTYHTHYTEPAAPAEALINDYELKPSPVELEAIGLIDDVDFDHLSFLPPMYFKDIFKTNGISLFKCFL